MTSVAQFMKELRSDSITSSYDSSDRKIAVPSYVPDNQEYIRALLLAMYYEQSEHLHADFTEAYSKFRRVVLEWMVDVCEYFHLHITTTHAAIAYLDRLQPNEKFSRFEWQMMAICCIIIASKYNECEEHVPGLKRLEEITQQSIGNELLLSYELFALKKMAWKLNVRSAIAFACSYLELEGGLLTQDDASFLLLGAASTSHTSSAVDDLASIHIALKQQVYALAYVTVLEEEYKAFQSSVVAAAIVFYARYRVLSCSDAAPYRLPYHRLWNEELTALTFHDCGQVGSAVQEVIKLLFIHHHKEGIEGGGGCFEEVVLGQGQGVVEDEEERWYEEEDEEELAQLLSLVADKEDSHSHYSPTSKQQRQHVAAVAMVTPLGKKTPSSGKLRQGEGEETASSAISTPSTVAEQFSPLSYHSSSSSTAMTSTLKKDMKKMQKQSSYTATSSSPETEDLLAIKRQGQLQGQAKKAAGLEEDDDEEGYLYNKAQLAD